MLTLEADHVDGLTDQLVTLLAFVRESGGWVDLPHDEFTLVWEGDEDPPAEVEGSLMRADEWKWRATRIGDTMRYTLEAI